MKYNVQQLVTGKEVPEVQGGAVVKLSDLLKKKQEGEAQPAVEEKVEKVVDDSDDEGVIYQPKIDCLDTTTPANGQDKEADAKKVSEKADSSDDDGP